MICISRLRPATTRALRQTACVAFIALSVSPISAAAGDQERDSRTVPRDDRGLAVVTRDHGRGLVLVTRDHGRGLAVVTRDHGRGLAVEPRSDRSGEDRLDADVRGRDLRRDPEVSPESVGFDPARLTRVDSVIRHALGSGASPGAALVIGRYGKLVRLRGYGRTDWNPLAPEVTDSTLYDLASLTKAMGTATVATQLASEGRLLLDAPIYRYLHGWPSTGRHGEITVRHLLAHTSGLPAGADLWPGSRLRWEILASLAQLRIQTAPGTRREYSDVGMILLGAVLEQVSGSRLDDLLAVRVFRPLQLHDTRFNPLTAHGESGSFTLAQIAPTEYDTYVRNGLVHGVVHDLNAWALDGVAGHAGLFSSARDMAVYGQAILDAAQGRDNPLFTTGTFQAWLRNERVRGRPLGWDVPNGRHSPAGLYFTRSSIGHTGFTGTSLWVDPERDVFVVLLTNRLNPSARNQKHVQLRRDVHDYVQLAIADMSIEARE